MQITSSRAFTHLLRLLMIASLALPAWGAAPAQAAPANAAPPENTWLSAVQQDIQRSEYHIAWSDGSASYQAPNRAHDLRAYFAGGGLRLTPRQSPSGQPAWELALRLQAYGRAGSLRSPGAPLEERAEHERFSYEYPGLEEWYLNRPEGLEHGFTLSSRLDGDGPLVLEIGLSGGLAARQIDDHGLEFATSGGVTVLHYDQLRAWDAAGQELPARMELLPAAGARADGDAYRLLLHIEDRQAAYPLTIDPLATTPNWMAENNQVSARFGWSVAAAGDVNGDGFGDVIVGAPYYDNGQTDEGAAFVYHGSPTGLNVASNWMAEGDQADALFGWSVATAGDVNGDGYADVIVGADNYQNGEINEGRAFVYHGSASGLSAAPEWTAEGNQTSASFGRAVATAGDVNGDGYSDVIVGAVNVSRVYVFHGSGGGLEAAAAWNVSMPGSEIGASVAAAGDVNGDGYGDVIIGATEAGSNKNGAAFVYHGSATGLGASADWTVLSSHAFAEFGTAVSAAGDVNGDGYSDVIVGAPYDDGSGETDEGRVYVYHGSASGLSTTADWTAESNRIFAYFGLSAALAGDVNGDGYADVIVGAPAYTTDVNPRGRAYVYYGSPNGLTAAAGWTAENDQISAYFGGSVASAGDVNGDGYGDVIVGTPYYDNGEADEGRAQVYFGSPAGPSAAPGWTAESNQAGAYFGYSVAAAGDVNGDGYGDIVVGAHGYDNGQDNEGRAFVFHGSPTGPSASAAWSAEGDQAYANFGKTVSTAGDVNGDGYADVIVGAFGYDNGEADEGRVYVYHGSPAGLSAGANWVAESNQVDAMFGGSASAAGDVNGDGCDDVIIGASFYNGNQGGEGRAYVYYGSSGGLNAGAAWMVEGGEANAYLGVSVSAAGDINGDGYGDVIIGAPR